jgi:ferredoxin
MEGNKAVVTEVCKACGRCISQCPRGAIQLYMDGEEKVFQQLLDRVSAVADITG